MQKITVTVPDNIHISIIADALSQLDAGITCKPCAKRARIAPSESEGVPEYVGQSDLEYRRYCTETEAQLEEKLYGRKAEYDAHSERWYIPEVMDGVSVDKAIRKIMSEVRKGQSSDGRNKCVYPRLYRGEPLDVDAYVRQFCGSLHHVAAQYTNGVTA